jgi:hypothetical protein
MRTVIFRKRQMFSGHTTLGNGVRRSAAVRQSGQRSNRANGSVVSAVASDPIAFPRDYDELLEQVPHHIEVLPWLLYH